MNATQKLILNILAGSLPTPERGEYYPVLLIGLGGFGQRAVRHTKRFLARHKANHVKVWCLDSDTNEQARFPDLPELADSELTLLDPEVAIRALDRAAAGKGDEHVLDFLPDECGEFRNLHRDFKAKVASGFGAGQFRRAGHLLLCANQMNGAGIKRKLDRLHQELVGMGPLIQQAHSDVRITNGVRVFIVTSLCGGTGAGFLIGLLALLRTKFTGPNDHISIIGALPGALLDRELIHDPRREALMTRANAYGLLQELESLQSGSLTDVEFRLDAHTRIPAREVYANNIFLVDQANSKGTPVNNWMDLARGLGCFLYSLVGEGIGASMASGQVNFAIEVCHATIGPQRVFSSLGVGAIEYPTIELLTGALFDSQAQWLSQWLVDDVGKHDTNLVAAQETAQLAGLNEVASLRAEIQGGEIDEAAYLADPNLRELMVKWPDSRDEEFISNGNSHRAAFEQRVSIHREAFERNAESRTQNARVVLARRFLGWLPMGIEVTAERLGQFRRLLDGLKSQALAEAQERANNLIELEAMLESLAGTIRTKNFLPDTKEKRQFVVKTNEWLQRKLESVLEPHLAVCLEAATRELDAFMAQTDALRVRAGAELKLSRDALAKMSTRPDTKGIVQSAFGPEEVVGWARSNRPPLAIPGEFQAADFDQIRIEVLTPVMQAYLSAVDSLDITHNSRNDQALLRKVKSTQIAAVPLMRIVPTGPQSEDMAPKRFVTAKLQEGDDPYVHQHFDQPTTACRTSNPNLIVCARTIHGFAAEEWSGYAEAKAAAAGREWMHSILPVSAPEPAGATSPGK
jgi:hypothetical protein